MAFMLTMAYRQENGDAAKELTEEESQQIAEEAMIASNVDLETIGIGADQE